MSKKLAAFVLILSALLAIAACAQADGDFIMHLQGDHNLVFSVFEDDPAIGLTHHNILHATIENFDKVKDSFQGSPNWSVTSSNPNVTVSILQNGTPHMDFSIFAGQPCDADITLICQWGGVTKQDGFHISFEQLTDPPAGLSIPAEVDTTLAEGYQCAMFFLPEGYQVPGGNHSYSMSRSSSDPEHCTVQLNPETFTALFTQTGDYTVHIRYSCSNVAIEKDIVFHVTEGVEPIFRMEIKGPHDEVFGIFADDPEIGLYHDERFRAVIVNYKEVRNQFNSEPEWRIISTNQKVRAEIFGGGNTAEFQVHADNPGDTDIRVICSWEGQVFADTLHIHFERLQNLPEGLSIPAEAALTFGETYEAALSFLPEDYQVGSRRSMGFDFEDMENAFVQMGEWPLVTAQFAQPGEYVGHAHYLSGNVAMEKQVLFTVTEGAEPVFHMTVKDPHEELFGIFADDPQIGLRHDNHFRAEIMDYKNVRNQFSSEPEWRIFSTNKMVRASISPQGSSADIFVEADKPCDADVVVFCSWEGQTVTDRFHVRFEPVNDPPEGLSIPDEVTVAFGEPYEAALSFLPEEFQMGDDREARLIFEDQANAIAQVIDQSFVIVDFAEPGDYTAHALYKTGNIVIEKDVVFHVTEGPSPVFRMDIKGPHDEVFGIFQDNPDIGLSHDESFRAVISNYKEVRNQFASDPVWRIVSTSQKVHADIIGHGDCADFWVHSDMPGEADVVVICSWEGQVWTDRLHIRFEHIQDLPEGLSIPDEVALAFGESYEGSLSILPEGFQLGSLRGMGFSFYDPEHAFVRMGERPLVTAHFTQPGEYAGFVHYHSGNMVMEKQVVFTVTESVAPVFNMEISGAHDEVFGIFADDPEIGLHHRNEINAGIMNYQAVRNQFTGEPEWRVVSTNQNVTADIYANGNFASIVLTADKPCDADILVFCAWEGQVKADRLHIRFEPLKNLPQGLAIPDEVTVAFGETYECDLSILPEGFQLGSRRGMGHTGLEHMMLRPGSKWPYMKAWFTEPGDYEVTLHSSMGNIVVEKKVTFHVTGTAPTLHLAGDLRVIEEEAFAFTSAQRVVIDSAERIESRAFADMPDLAVVVLPDSISFIADDAFDPNPNLIFVCHQSDYARNWVNSHNYLMIVEQ